MEEGTKGVSKGPILEGQSLVTAPSRLSEVNGRNCMALFGMITSVAPQGAAPILGHTEYVVTHSKKESAVISHGTTLDSTLGEVNIECECSEDALVAIKKDFPNKARHTKQ